MVQSSSNIRKEYLTQLYVINRLLVKVCDAPTLEALKFIILNDTLHLVYYNQALLFSYEEGKPTLIGISGQDSVNKHSELVKKWDLLIKHLKNPEEGKVITSESFSEQQALYEELHEKSKSLIVWQPIFVQNKMVLGLWLERWDSTPDDIPPEDTLSLLKNFLMPGYGAAWSKLSPLFSPSTMLGVSKKTIYYGCLAAFVLLMIIRVPLRVVAPCEVVPKNPFVITAPIDGIIKEVVVKPSQVVKKGEILFEYNKKAPEQELRVAEKQVDVMQSEVNRAMTQGLTEKESLEQLAILKFKLEKEKLNLEFARYQNGLLDVKAPDAGIVIMDAPDDWRGRAVKTGEKVMTISDPSDTKVRIWIPESDNVVLDPEKEIKVILNTNPTKTYIAKQIYIANESKLSDLQVPSFIGEANWEEAPPPEVKLGLKGTAILYGDSVSLFYYIIRKPWGTLRSLLGL